MKKTYLTNRPMRTYLTGAIGAVCALTAFSAFAGIAGSNHDLRTWLGLTAQDQICLPCHTPHDATGNSGLANPNLGTPVADAPLWNHSITDAATQYQMYSTIGSGTIDGTEDTRPTGASALCLSCHDGTVGVDQYDGFPATGTARSILDTDMGFVGTDLRGQHPISITYADTVDTTLHARTTSVTIGGWTDGVNTNPSRTGTIEDIMLQGTGTVAKVQCSSCHDVHNTLVATNQFFLKISMEGSALCLTCHNK